MRILSLSDIHNNLTAFELFLAEVPDNSFDAVVVAGDMGDVDPARIMMRELATFGKPVYYVMGNWDAFPYDRTLHQGATHLHLNHQQVDGWTFLGYSGSVANYFQNHPTLSRAAGAYKRLPKNKRKEAGSFERYCQQRVWGELESYVTKHKINTDKLILVTHDRFYAPALPVHLYLFGHRHKPLYTKHKGIHLVNTAAVSMFAPFGRESYSDVPGNFCLIDLAEESCKVSFREIPTPYVRAEHPDLRPGTYMLVDRKTGKPTGRIEGD